MALVGSRCSPIDDGSLFDLGPVITVFIKYDRLVEQVELGDNSEFHKHNRTAEMHVSLKRQEQRSVGPFKDVLGPDIPHIAVSSKPQRDF